MILDTSALVAIFFGEPEAALYTQLIHDADRCLMSAHMRSAAIPKEEPWTPRAGCSRNSLG
jgi:uncharacterized protein with PIN domain